MPGSALVLAPPSPPAEYFEGDAGQTCEDLGFTGPSDAGHCQQAATALGYGTIADQFGDGYPRCFVYLLEVPSQGYPAGTAFYTDDAILDG